MVWYISVRRSGSRWDGYDSECVNHVELAYRKYPNYMTLAIL